MADLDAVPIVEGPEFNCPQHLGLINADSQCPDEIWAFTWAKRLRSAYKYWWVHKLEYEDIAGEIHVAKAAEQTQQLFFSRDMLSKTT